MRSQRLLLGEEMAEMKKKGIFSFFYNEHVTFYKNGNNVFTSDD